LRTAAFPALRRDCVPGDGLTCRLVRGLVSDDKGGAVPCALRGSSMARRGSLDRSRGAHADATDRLTRSRPDARGRRKTPLVAPTAYSRPGSTRRSADRRAPTGRLQCSQAAPSVPPGGVLCPHRLSACPTLIPPRRSLVRLACDRLARGVRACLVTSRRRARSHLAQQLIGTPRSLEAQRGSLAGASPTMALRPEAHDDAGGRAILSAPLDKQRLAALVERAGLRQSRA